MYSISDYGEMIADKVRMDPYAYALKDAIGPNTVVLDIGTGTGIHALLACKFGARKVYAVEPNDAIHLARKLALDNGFNDRIEFFQGVSTRITLPDKADVIVSDLRGVLPLYGAHIPAVIDARQRHLAPGGILIPKHDTIWVSLVEATAVYNELTAPWDRPYGLVMEKANRLVLNEWIEEEIDTFQKSDLLMRPQIWTELDYTSIENPDIRPSSLIQAASRDGTAHGLLLWFDGELADGIHIFNNPLTDKSPEVYGCGFFPLLEPVSITKSDRITLDLSAEFIQGDYIWHWHTRIQSGYDSQSIKADYIQSNSLDSDLEYNALHESVLKLMPTRAKEGEIDHLILGKMDGANTIEQIAEFIYGRFPVRFKTKAEAQFYVNDLSQQYGR